jgi:hypothetical protein
MLKNKNLVKVGDSRFAFNGNLIAELGEESISNDNVAIAELIKNSYDADSSSVDLSFLEIEKHNASISIEDDGKGMDIIDIKDRFMEIGSPHKKDISKTDIYNRVPVGAKGIGRFGSHGLGNFLELKTSVKGGRDGYEAHFDWSLFTSKVKVTDVNVPTFSFKKKATEHGTRLLIKNLKDSWNDSEKTKSLLKDLELLLSPVDPPKNFKIKHNLDLEGVPIPKIKKVFFDKAAYTLKVKLTKKKVIDLEFKKLGKVVSKEKKELRGNLSCGDVTFELYFYYKTNNGWKDNTGVEITEKDRKYIKSILDEYGGIKLYRDYFRVKPYGEIASDWIGLDQWSRNNSMIPGNTQAFGVVTIGRDKNPKIEDTTTREGVLNNAEYFDLVKFVTTSVSEFADLRSEQETHKVKGKKKKKKTKTVKVEKPKAGESLSVSKGEPFIDVTGSFPSSHYNQIIHEANECYDRNYPNATFWLVRKIIENLVTHILEKKYPKTPDLWYNKGKKRVLNFSQLTDNLYSNRKDFKAPKAVNQIQILNSDINKIRLAINSTVHNNHDYLTDRDDLKKYKIGKIIQNLVDIYAVAEK